MKHFEIDLVLRFENFEILAMEGKLFFGRNHIVMFIFLAINRMSGA